MPRLYLCALLLVSLLSFGDGTLSKSDRKPKNKQKASDNNKPEKQGFMKLDDTEKKNMLEQSEAIYNDDRHFLNPTLAYVTPWNGKGYDVAKFAAKKFTHISPVWFQVIPSEKSCTIEGTHDIDQGWIADVRSNNSEVAFVPRFIFERWSAKDYSSFLHNEIWQKKCAERIINLILGSAMQGAVFEVWTQMISVVGPQFREEILEFITETGTLFHDQHLQLITTVPAELDSKSQPIGITLPSDISKMAENVDLVHVMTYDFKADALRGVAPLFWIHANMKYLLQDSPSSASKLLLGINFYGYQIKAKQFAAVTAPSFKELLSEDDTELYWDAYSEETFGLSKKRQEMTYFPTMDSISKRLELAKTLGIGIGIWEIGQGFDSFTKLL